MTPAVEVVDVGKRFRRSADRRTTLKELIVRGKSRHVDEFWALREVSLNIPKGSVYGIVGHNVHRSQEYRYPWTSGALLRGRKQRRKPERDERSVRYHLPA